MVAVPNFPNIPLVRILGDIPPWSAAFCDTNTLAGQYGGVMKIWVRFGKDETHRFDLNMIQNQTDWLYISGHGSWSTGIVAGLNPGYSGTSNIDWNGDVKYVIIAGCSVLDAWYGYLPETTDGVGERHLPGRTWAKTGPKFLFGYHDYAPEDNLWSGFDPNYMAKIVSTFLSIRNSMSLPKAWLVANQAHAWQYDNGVRQLTRAANATALDVENNTCWHMIWLGGTSTWEEIPERME